MKTYRKVRKEFNFYEFNLLETLRLYAHTFIPSDTEEKINELIEFLENKVEKEFPNEEIENITYYCEYDLSKKE